MIIIIIYSIIKLYYFIVFLVLLILNWSFLNILNISLLICVIYNNNRY